VDGAGEAAHGDEGAGAVVHAARARAVHVVASADRACRPLPPSLCLRVYAPRSAREPMAWGGERQVARGFLPNPGARSHGRIGHEGPVWPVSATPVVRSLGVWCQQVANMRLRPVPNAEGCLARKAPYSSLINPIRTL
jgi:hypothetical protein